MRDPWTGSSIHGSLVYDSYLYLHVTSQEQSPKTESTPSLHFEICFLLRMATGMITIEIRLQNESEGDDAPGSRSCDFLRATIQLELKGELKTK